MIEEYEKIFNAEGSTINVDNTWGKFQQGKYPMKERYDYSLEHLWGNVLEVGAGDGFFTFMLHKSSRVDHVIALEIQNKAIARMNTNLEKCLNVTIVKGIIEDFKNPPESDHFFTSIHCGHTLEHVFDVRASLQAIKDLQAKVNVISVPIRGGRSKQHLTEWRTADEFLKLMREFFQLQEFREFKTGGGKTSLVVIAKNKK